MAIDTGPRSAPRSVPSRTRVVWRSLVPSLVRAARAYPRRNAMTAAYLLVILAGLLLLTKILTGPAADHLKIAISTNPHNMAHAPLTVLLASPLFAATDSGLLSHLLIIAGGVGICMAALERRLGPARTAALFLLANTVATAVATGVAAAAIHSGRYPAKWWDGYDYGISYGVLAIAAAVTPLVPKAVRIPWAAGVFAYPFVSAQWFGLLPNFATIGHETAAAFGLAAGYFLLRNATPPG
ncbi:rhomboid-like protein [Catenulispora rubra]|uniref:rhomboid-like protein n=1 Tax=Catenulispora rubra TaxID=280293 RepID=UPI0018920F80|nr:rhomboid-like protein [Catenulispora rubra]